MLQQLAVTATDAVLAALARAGRTEDVAFSADGGRLAIAGFGTDSVILLELSIDDKPGDTSVTITGLTEIWSPQLRDPHGVAFLGTGALVVANRAGEAPIFELPAREIGLRRVWVEAVAVVGPGSGAELQAPGSVRAGQLAPDLHEVLICDNAANVVTRHVVDVRGAPSVVDGAVLAAYGLAIPDSVACSGDRSWLAVSNHDTHSVLLFADPGDLGPDDPPVGHLENVTYPHGLAFVHGDAYVVVADAGAPFLHVYARGDNDWRGVRQPVRSLRVMDDETFLRGRYNIQEGGPKGLSIDATTGVLAISSEHQTLAFFDLVDVIGPDGEHSDPTRDDGEPVRRALLRGLRNTATARADERALRAAIAAAERRGADLSEALDTARRLGDERHAASTAAQARTAKELAEARQRAREATEAASQADVARRELEANGEVLAGHVAHLEAVIADRDRQLDALRASTSWRITAPLRRMTRLRRGRRAPASRR